MMPLGGSLEVYIMINGLVSTKQASWWMVQDGESLNYNKSLAQCLGFCPMTLPHSGAGLVIPWFNSRCNCINWRNSSMLDRFTDCEGTVRCELWPVSFAVFCKIT